LDSDLNANSNAHSVRHTNNNCNANCDCHGNSNGYCNGHADSDRYPNTYAYPMHGEMYANAAASPHSVNAPITFKFVQSVADTNRPFQFQKRSQYFFGADDETLSVAMRLRNPDRSPFAIHS
jgi:hypothetical protein